MARTKKAGVRLQRRDWLITEHLFRTRALSTRQIADLEFGGGFHAAQSRLYLLKKVGFLNNSTGHGETGTIWQLSKKTFRAMTGDGRQIRYPGPLGAFVLEHLIATNEIYVLIFHPLQRAEELQENWRWTGEPLCHRRYSTRLGGDSQYVLKPDAEVEVLDRIFFMECQTARARERPEKLYDKTFAYHRFENSIERKRDPREMTLVWACDEERDAKTVLRARAHHPSRDLDKHYPDSPLEHRMTVEAGTVQAVAGFLLEQARQLVS